MFHVNYIFFKNYYKDKTVTGNDKKVETIAATSSVNLDVNILPDTLSETQKEMVKQFSLKSNLTYLWAHE